MPDTSDDILTQDEALMLNRVIEDKIVSTLEKLTHEPPTNQTPGCETEAFGASAGADARQ